MRLILIDDHALFRLGLIAILKKEPSISMIRAYRSFEEVKSILPNLSADVALIDLSLEKESGLDVARYLRKVNRSIKVVILSSHKEEFYLVRALEINVDGYIHKDSEPEELIRGIKKVFSGEKFYSLEISSLLIKNIYTKPQNEIPFLTLKEKMVIKFLMDGFSTEEIAVKLKISLKTAETLGANILDKLGLKNTTELLKKIVEQKIRF